MLQNIFTLFIQKATDMWNEFIQHGYVRL